MIKTFFLLFIFVGFSTVASAKSIKNQIKEDGLKVVIDYSAIINKQLTEDNICNQRYTPTKLNNAGVPIKMLGFANVYMGAGPGISKFGHLGERFVYCIGNQLYDIYYDGIKLDKNVLPIFETDYNGARQEYITSNKVVNALYYRKIQNPTQLDVYGSDTVQTNRNIYEQWLDISEEEILNLLVKNINRINLQTTRISREEKLATFNGILNNCTYQVTDDLQSIPTLKSTQVEVLTGFESDSSGTPSLVPLSTTLRSIHPKAVYNALTEGRVTKLLVIYPSQDNVRKILFNKSSFENAIKILEVPAINLNPKFSVEWSEGELNQIKNELSDYQSPLTDFLKDKINE